MTLVYSCCLWFSLRLGGIIIAVISIGILQIIFCAVLHRNSQRIKNEVLDWINSMNLIYMKAYFEDFAEDPEKYITLFITLSCIFVAACVLYIYGAYYYINILMYCYIILEFGRLVVISLGTITWLLILKRNTMDIGLLIGASVASGFLLLGLFYLWLCAATLPLLINEMESEDQAATIAKLQLLLEEQNSRRFLQDNFVNATDNEYYRHGVFTIPRNTRKSYLLK